MFFQNEPYILVTHYDLDGSGCAIQFQKYFGETLKYIQYTGYEKFEQNIEKLVNRIDCQNIVVTDISLEFYDIIQKHFKKIFWIDHHETSLNYIDKITFPAFVNTKVCATKLIQKLFEQKFNINYSEDMKLLVYHINDYDLFEIEDDDSLILNEIFWQQKAWEFAKIFTDGYKHDAKLFAAGQKVIDDKQVAFNSAEKYVIDDNLMIIITDKVINEVSLFDEQKLNYYVIIRGEKMIGLRSRVSMIPLYEYINDRFNDTDIKCGGHKTAGGVTILNDNITVDDIIDCIGEWYEFNH